MLLSSFGSSFQAGLVKVGKRTEASFSQQAYVFEKSALQAKPINCNEISSAKQTGGN